MHIQDVSKYFEYIVEMSNKSNSVQTGKSNIPVLPEILYQIQIKLIKSKNL